MLPLPSHCSSAGSRMSAVPAARARPRARCLASTAASAARRAADESHPAAAVRAMHGGSAPEASSAADSASCRQQQQQQQQATGSSQQSDEMGSGSCRRCGTTAGNASANTAPTHLACSIGSGWPITAPLRLPRLNLCCLGGACRCAHHNRPSRRQWSSRGGAFGRLVAQLSAAAATAAVTTATTAAAADVSRWLHWPT